ncbi:MAG: penicillin-binding protein, partial [Faecalibacillus sp.]
MKKLNIKKISGALMIIIIVICLGFAGVFGYNVYKNTAAFDAKKLLSSGASQIYDSEGNVIYTYGSGENGKRKNITYDDLPQVLIDAVVAA